jgi:cytochrome c
MTKYLFYAFVLGALASYAAAGPLHDAVKDGDIAQAKLLIAQGEDVNKRDSMLGSPLHQAAILGDGDMARLLVAEGADVDVDHSTFGTPLNLAALNGNEAVATVLIANGADVDARLIVGTTPLHAAASGGHVAVIELLVANGADVNARSRNTRTLIGDHAPIHSAGLNGHFDVVALLRALGATGPTIEPLGDLFVSADPAEGEKIFMFEGLVVKKRCARCHAIEKGPESEPMLGPNLWGVFGRTKASVEGASYSAALSRLGGTWTVAELNAFITAPVDYLPGTTMWTWGIKDPVDRANLIAYLRQNSDDAPSLPVSITDK